MLESLKQTGKNISHELSKAWDSLSDGWRDVLNRSSNALTQFTEGKGEQRQIGDAVGAGGGVPAAIPRWGLLAGEVEETEKEVLVRLEVPGMQKEDCKITIEGNVLCLRGEKRFERETGDSTYHVMERAYGSFQRSVLLPGNVDTDKADASYKNGVLTVRLPKTHANFVQVT